MRYDYWTRFTITFVVVATNSLPAFDLDLFNTDDHDLFTTAQSSDVTDWNLDPFMNTDDLATIDSNASLYDADLEAFVPNATSGPWDDTSTAWDQDLVASSASSDSCDTSNNDLQRRAKFCRPDDVQIRPLSPEEVESGTKLAPPDYKRAICPTVRLRPGGWDIALHIHAMCDSGDVQTLAPLDEVAVLENCTPFDWRTGCFTPHQIWCCHSILPKIPSSSVPPTAELQEKLTDIFDQFEMVPKYDGQKCVRANDLNLANPGTL